MNWEGQSCKSEEGQWRFVVILGSVLVLWRARPCKSRHSSGWPEGKCKDNGLQTSDAVDPSSTASTGAGLREPTVALTIARDPASKTRLTAARKPRVSHQAVHAEL